MKKSTIKRTLTASALLFVLLFSVVSCSKSKMENVMDAIPADADLVIVGDINTIMESLGGKVEGSELTFPSTLTDMMSSSELSDFEDGMDLLKKSSINLEACACVLDIKEERTIFIATIEDESQFIKTIESEDFNEDSDEDGLVIYEKKEEYGGRNYIAIKGSYAYFLPYIYRDEFKADKYLTKFVESADEKPFSDTGMGEYIAESNVGGASFKLSKWLREELEEEGLPSDLTKMCKGFVCCRGNLNDNAASITLKVFNEDGDPVKAEDFGNKINPDATINVDALKYIHKNENMLYAMSLKDFDWDQIDNVADAAHLSNSDRTGLVLIKSYLERIDGTVAVGMGVKDGASSMERIVNGENIDNDLAFTMVVEVKSGKAETIINDIKVLFDSEQVPYENRPDGIRLTIPETTTVNIEKRGDLVIISNRTIEENENKLVESIDFSDKNMVVAANLPKDGNFLEEFGINKRIKMVMYSNLKNMEVELTLEVGEPDDGGLLEQLFGFYKKYNEYRHRRMEEVMIEETADPYYDDYAEAYPAEALVEDDEYYY